MVDEFRRHDYILKSDKLIGQIDVAETFLVMNDNYIDGCSAVELVKRARIHNLFDDSLCDFLIKIVRLRNRYTHDYYKRDGVEEDIFNVVFLK